MQNLEAELIAAQTEAKAWKLLAETRLEGIQRLLSNWSIISLWEKGEPRGDE
jgi:hypothetical protein